MSVEATPKGAWKITFLLFLVWIWGASYVTGGLEAAWNGLDPLD